MPGGFNLIEIQRAGSGHDICRYIAAARQRLRRGQASTDDRATIPQQFHAHEASFLLKDQRVAADTSVCQYEGGADIGMPSERQFALGSENANFRGVTR